MGKNNTLHVLVTVVLLIALALLADLFPFWMPDMMAMIVLVLVAVLMLLWAGFVMHENGGDERETLHRMYAGRGAYLSGIGILTIALLVQGLAHDIDLWIPATLAVMVVAKLVTRLYLDKHR